MSEILRLKERIGSFSKVIGSKKELKVHEGNKFNKQFGLLAKDWEYLNIIWKRIESADAHEESTQLGLDLKSLYVFGRIFSESMLYIVSLFIPSTKEIDWTKIGIFVKTTTENLSDQPDEFKNFWSSVGESIIRLNQIFRYRNHVLHEKDSNTEWTMAWPGKSNLDHVSLANVPWSEDKGKKKEIKSLNARELMNVLENDTNAILSYIEITAESRYFE